MYLRVTQKGELSLQDCDNLRAFAIVLDAADASLTALAEIATPAEDDHYWIDAYAVEELSQRKQDQQWLRDFRAMLAAVAPYGYYDKAGNRVKAHVEIADV